MKTIDQFLKKHVSTIKEIVWYLYYTKYYNENHKKYLPWANHKVVEDVVKILSITVTITKNSSLFQLWRSWRWRASIIHVRTLPSRSNLNTTLRDSFRVVYKVDPPCSWRPYVDISGLCKCTYTKTLSCLQRESILIKLTCEKKAKKSKSLDFEIRS